jgi:hypothetical protein
MSQTKLRSGALRGVQRPRVSLVPPSVSNDFEDAVDLAAGYGLTADEWQEDVLEGWLGRSHSGKWSASRCGLAVPRQNGKNGVLEIRELFGMVILGEKFLHTAHEVKTARKAFTRLLGFFENERKYPELAGMVKEIRKTNGQEAILLTNGGSIEFVARSKGSGRGFTVDVLVCDESQDLTDEQLAALLPTISAAPSGNPQLILTGTPPALNMGGDVFTRMRKAGLKRLDNRLCWKEWSLLPGDDLNDRMNWAKVNPSLGFRLAVETIADEREAMDDDTFGRERGGIWEDEESTGSAISPTDWAARLDIESSISGKPSFALDVSPMLTHAAICVAGKRGDGDTHGELLLRDGQERLDYRPGTDWVLPALADLKTRIPDLTVSIVKGSQAESLTPDIEALGITVNRVQLADVAAACGLVYKLATGGGLWHIGQPQLSAAVAATKWRDVGDGAQAWGRKKSGSDIAPMFAFTLAVSQAQVVYDPLANIF